MNCLDASQNRGVAVKKREDTQKWQKLIELLHIIDGNIRLIRMTYDSNR